jgi:hypothetical protein
MCRGRDQHHICLDATVGVVIDHVPYRQDKRNQTVFLAQEATFVLLAPNAAVLDCLNRAAPKKRDDSALCHNIQKPTLAFLARRSSIDFGSAHPQYCHILA